MTASIDPQFVRVPHEPSADARRAEILAYRISAARARTEFAVARQEATGEADPNLAADLLVILSLRAPGTPEPPVVPGASS